MNDPEGAVTLDVINEKLDRLSQSVERTRRYLWWGFILQLAMVLVPLLLIMLAIPFLLSTLQGVIGDGLL